ncbi:MAG: methylenetetrahydrofolate reductase [NAD(P)H], partial [Syntrophales bacterium]
MKINNLFSQKRFILSFEVFPPKREGNLESLYVTITELEELKPDFISVTYGAGGGTREKTIEISSKVKNGFNLEVLAHLTCVQSTKDDIAGILELLKGVNVENILALRGDPPEGTERFIKTEGGFEHANELVQFIKTRDDFSVGVAGYPEGHIENPSREIDLKNLKAKVDAGLEFVITQLFFDNAFYFDFVERAHRIGINVPIVPGIMPITNYEQLNRFVRMCGATVPMRLSLQLEKVKDHPEAVMQLGIAHATVQCIELLARGVPGIHFYTLNRSPATRMIVSALRAR